MKCNCKATKLQGKEAYFGIAFILNSSTEFGHFRLVSIPNQVDPVHQEITDLCNGIFKLIDKHGRKAIPDGRFTYFVLMHFLTQKISILPAKF